MTSSSENAIQEFDPIFPRGKFELALGAFLPNATFCRRCGGCGGGSASRSIFQLNHCRFFRNSTPRNRSRTTKIVGPGLGASSDLQFSAETPMDFDTFHGGSLHFHINHSRSRASVFRPKIVAMLGPRNRRNAAMLLRGTLAFSCSL